MIGSFRKRISSSLYFMICIIPILRDERIPVVLVVLTYERKLNLFHASNNKTVNKFILIGKGI